MGSVVSPNEYRVGPAASALFMVRGEKLRHCVDRGMSLEE